MKIYKPIYSTINVLNHTNYFKIFTTFLIAGVLISLTGINSIAASNSQSHNLHFGKIASINHGWILSGSLITDINKTNPANGGFYSIFNMVMTNGSAPHIHKIYNATVNNVTQKGNETIIDGTISITMKNGPVDNVPTKVIIGNNNTIAISLDSSKTGNHFGNTPIYGLFNNQKEGMTVIKMLVSDPEMMKKWIPMITGNIMQNIKDWKRNHPMMNDNMSSNILMMMMMMKHPMMNDNMFNNYSK